MSTTRSASIGGNTGLSLLVLMVVALVAGERQANLDIADPTLRSTAPVAPQLLFESAPIRRDEVIRGAIRELRVIPATIDSRLDLGWTPDADLIEKHRQASF